MTDLPADVAERWEWQGPFLALKATHNRGVGLAICATTYPPPACFASARFFDQKDRERPPQIMQERLLCSHTTRTL